MRRLEGPEAVEDVVPRLLLKPWDGVLITLFRSGSSAPALFGLSRDSSRSRPSRSFSRICWYVDSPTSFWYTCFAEGRGELASVKSLVEPEPIAVGIRYIFCRPPKRLLPSVGRGLERRAPASPLA